MEDDDFQARACEWPSNPGCQEFGRTDIELKPLEDRPTLICVSDEEGVQFRVLNLLFGPMRLRGMPLPEAAHPCWGDASRALQSAGLKSAVLKGTLMCNHYRGPYKSGKWGFDLQQCAKRLCLTCTDDFLESLSPSFETVGERSASEAWGTRLTSAILKPS